MYHIDNRAQLVLALCLAMIGCCSCKEKNEKASEPTRVEHPSSAQKLPEKTEDAREQKETLPMNTGDTSKKRDAGTIEETWVDSGTDETQKPARPTEENPCAKREVVSLKLHQGRTEKTPWGLEFKYLGGGHKILMGPHGGRGGDRAFFDFTLRRGKKMTRVQRDGEIWRWAWNWDGFCWRGKGRAGWHPREVTVEVVPNCDAAGQLVKRGCKGVFKAKRH